MLDRLNASSHLNLAVDRVAAGLAQSSTETLDLIATWPPMAYIQVFDLLGQYWVSGKSSAYCRAHHRITLTTGGLTPNEELLCSLRRNTALWSACWQASFRGGRYVFEIPSEKL